MKTSTDLRHIYPQLSITLTDGAGVAHALDGHSVSAGSLSIKTGTSESGTFSVGGAVSGAASFTLIGTDLAPIPWDGAVVDITLTCAGTACNMGRYYVSTHQEQGDSIPVTAYDALMLMDDETVGDLGITWPSTAGAVAGAIADAHGLTLSGVRDGALAIETADETMTQRQCLHYIAQAMGQYVAIRAGALVFDWYDMGTVTAAGNTFSHSFGTSDVTVTGVRVQDSDGAVTDRGTEGYVVGIASNPFITSDNVEDVADMIWGAVGGITFRPGQAVITSSPAYDAGDVVTVNTRGEAGVVLILTAITYTMDVAMDVTANADPQAEIVARCPFVRTSDASRAVADGIDDQLDDPNSRLSQALGGGSSGNCEAILVIEQSCRIPSASDASAAGLARGTTTGIVWNRTEGMSEYEAGGRAIAIPRQELIIPRFHLNGTLDEHGHYITVGGPFLVPVKVYTGANLCVAHFYFMMDNPDGQEHLYFEYNLNSDDPPWAQVMQHTDSRMYLYHVPMNLWRAKKGDELFTGYRPLQGLRDTGGTTPDYVGPGGGDETRYPKLRIFEWF